MKNQSISSLKGVLLLSGAVFLTACGGGMRFTSIPHKIRLWPHAMMAASVRLV